MKTALVFLALSLPALPAMAQTPADCTADAGDYLTGVVTKKPYWVKASETLDGIQLSHTHVTIRSDSNSKLYDVAMDNVFAPDWVKNSSKIPASLAAIKLGNHLSLCGLLYTSGGLGIHWVHDSCGQPPTQSNPNGWTSIVTNGTVGPNLENSQTYCYLWNE